MKNVVICLNIDDQSFKSLEKIKELVPLESAKVTLLHIWNKGAYSYPGEMIVPFYPDENQASKIEKELEAQLEKQIESFSGSDKSTFQSVVFSSSSPKQDMVEYLTNNKIDIVVCMTPEKSGVSNFFHSSFTNYLTTHAPCSVLAVRI